MRKILAALATLALITAANAQTISSTPVPYAIGTWTPTIVSSGGGTPTYSAQTGFYEQIGRQVTVRFTVTLATLGTLAAGTASVGGLPFPASGTGTCIISQYGSVTLAASNWGIGGLILDTTSVLALVSFNNTTSTLLQAATHITATSFFIGMCSYKAS